MYSFYLKTDRLQLNNYQFFDIWTIMVKTTLLNEYCITIISLKMSDNKDYS